MAPRQQFNLASALSGFAIGCVVTMLATIAIVPDGGTGRGGAPVVIGGGGPFAAGDVPDLDESDLAEGEQFAMDAETGETFVIDATGERVRSVGPAGGSAPAEGGGGTARDAGTATGAVDVGGGGGGTRGDGGGGGGDIDPSGLECAPGKNGGATDTGVTATEIKLGATTAEGGIARSFLGEVKFGMEAIRARVNREGGICGRQLRIIYRDDEWQADRGARFIQNLVEGEGVFALAVSPSSEGLNQASSQGYFRRHQVPVVGADGLNVTQFEDPFIWPVAAATTTTVNVMMQNAHARGMRNPAIVFGNTYRFGVEGAFAANAAYHELEGKNIPGYSNPLAAGGGGCPAGGRFCGISANDTQFATQVSRVNSACEQAPRCDYLILLLEPSTAQNWMGTTGAWAPKDYPRGIGAPQPLFTFDFADTCGEQCKDMWLWTGYNPPIAQYQGRAEVQRYVQELEGQRGNADKYNQFTMGGYVGMQLLVKALEEVGPALTRERLVAALDSMGPLQTGLTAAPGLQWRPNQRYANHSAQAFAVQYLNGFRGWNLVQSALRDPWPGQHTGS